MGEEITLRVSEREFHTILAALRYWADEECQAPHDYSEYMRVIAANGGEVVPLPRDEVVALCERINLL